MANDYVYLLTAIFVLAQNILSQGRHDIFNRVPSLISIWGNEVTDQLLDKGMLPHDMGIQISIALLKCRVLAKGHAGVLQN